MTTSLACDEAGDGIPVVFLHGLTFSRRTWRPVVDLLSDRFRCISVDLPAHGETGGSPATLRQVAERVHSSVVDLGAEPPVVVGHSMAAIIASLYAADFPARGVVNVDQPLLVGRFAQLVQQLAPALRADFHRAFAPFRDSIGVDTLPEPIRSQTLSTQTIERDVVLGYWGEVLDKGPDALQSMITATLQAIRTPYLAVMGQQVSDDESEYMRANLGDVRIEEWDGQGHMLHLADPERFARRLAIFVNEELRLR